MTKHRASSIGFIVILMVLFPLVVLVLGTYASCKLINNEIKSEFNEEGRD
jgi:uncharacterized protein YneF (UPF0154 family)